MSNPAPRSEPSPAALTFIRWAVEHFGVVDGARATIPRTQSELCLAYGRGNGTITWYMGCLRAGGIVSGRKPLVVDLDALGATARGADSLPGAAGPASSGPVTGGGLEVEVRDLLIRQAELLAEFAALNADLTRLLVAAGPSSAAGFEDGRGFAIVRDSQVAGVANSRETRDDQEVQEGRKVDSTFLPHFANPIATEIATGRDSRSELETDLGAGPPLSAIEVRELLVDLSRWCQQHGRPTIDGNGIEALRGFSGPEVAAAAEAVLRDAERDDSIHSPMGLLIHRANTKHPSFTTPPASAPACTTEGDTGDLVAVQVEEDNLPDPEAVAAVAALETDPARAGELAELDETVSARLGSGAVADQLCRVILGNPARRTIARQQAWRDLHPSDSVPVAQAASASPASGS